ncbi:GAF and ANTAR domain-containing protein [Streptomyces mesophilus]|uniref:GAF and ANTAR domain-containing protein n=1 Tax=Streptomyces mesophilus TaxID=1775132 RepID=UPI002E2E3C80|nr:GAF and ANTAR domain-containing protein [Streptomyces mesophilus]
MERRPVISDGMAEVLRSLRPGSGGDPAAAGARALGVPGVAVSVFPRSPDGVGAVRAPEPLWCFPELSLRFEELQFTLGEGPGPDAVRAGIPVLEPDLRLVAPDRWPVFLAAAQQLGVHGVCCFPLALGGARIGLLTLLCDGSGPLSDIQLQDTNTLTAALIASLLGDRGPLDGLSSMNGGPVGSDGAAGHDGDGLWPPEGLRRAVVHQATGMISVQLDTTLAQALVRLRAYAYSSGRPLGDVAEDVVARRLRFEGAMDDDGNGPHSPDGGEG